MRTLGMVLILATLGPAMPAAVGDGACGGDPACATQAGCPDPNGCGDPNCCARCGRHVACHPKACQLVCGVKKEKKYTWSVECEEFCTMLPGPRDKCSCGRCDDNCVGNCCDHCGKRYNPPKCVRPKCVKKLVKKEYEIEVPQYKCVVVYLCCDCAEDRTEPADAPKAGPVVPPAPLPAAFKAPPAPAPKARKAPPAPNANAAASVKANPLPPEPAPLPSL